MSRRLGFFPKTDRAPALSTTRTTNWKIGFLRISVDMTTFPTPRTSPAVSQISGDMAISPSSNGLQVILPAPEGVQSDRSNVHQAFPWPMMRTSP